MVFETRGTTSQVTEDIQGMVCFRCSLPRPRLTSLQRFSFELEAFEECRVTDEYIDSCDCSEELHALSDCIRRKWVLTQRTVEARIKHHRLFYAGGDVSHQAFIDNLTKQKMLLEEKLLQIDERAYLVGVIQLNSTKVVLDVTCVLPAT